MSHFNDKAAQWDEPGKIEMMKILASRAMDALKLVGPLDILDFGCGTGLFGLEFSDYASSLVGVDTSSGMLQVFDEKTKDFDHIRSVLINLEDEDLGEKFDLIVSSMAFHHLDSPGKMISKFKSMLNDDGRIVIVDLDKEDGTFHPNNKEMGVKHLGFAKDVVLDWAAKEDMKAEHHLINEIVKNGKKYHQFLAIFHK